MERHDKDTPRTGTLYLVATPIGNPRDITLRAIDVLSSVAIIAAEDTRDVASLLSAHGIRTRTVSYHDFNERGRARMLVERLQAGDDVALVSDAGTPLVNDPGYRLVRAAVEAGVPVTSVPGPCAAIAGLVASGLPLDRFLFVGYPPRTQSKRRTFFEELAGETATLVLYEAPHRLAASLRDAYESLGDREACLARNLTKPHEHLQRGRLADVLTLLRDEGEIRGEFTLIVAGARRDDQGRDDASVRALATQLVRDGVPMRAAAHELCTAFGLRRRQAYALLLDAERDATAQGEP